MNKLEIAGVTITHPEKILYPESGVNKYQVATYYKQVAEQMLPYVVNRPLSLVRSPHGVGDVTFYQKHPSESFPDYIERVKIKEKEGTGVYITIDGLNDLIYLVNIGVLEFHTWLSTVDNLEYPDQIVFDLDPDPEAPWEIVVEGAFLIKEELETIGLQQYIKVSGIKGLHILAPLDGQRSWEEAKALTKGIGDLLAGKFPNKFTTSLPKAKRKGKVFIDYLRNTRGATNIAPFSTRAYKQGTLSLPVSWDDVKAGIKPGHFTIKEFLDEQKYRNPWPAKL